MKITRMGFKCYCLIIFLFAMGTASAVTRTAISIADLQAKINISGPDDIIILADGTYLNNTFDVSKSGITVKAATPGGVFLNGTNAITISGSNVTFSGFQFTSGTITGNVITVTGSSNTLTQLNFNGYSAQKMIVLDAAGQNNIISYCNFQNKPVGAAIGNLIHIDPNASLPGYHKIRYCSFQNMPGAGGDNGNECIRISNGATSTYISRTIVEYNYFSNTGPGDSEAISVKCRENVLRYNTMVNNLQANFCFRNGDNNVAYGNFFKNSGGIRVKEANNIYCYNNYFENCGDGVITAPVKYVYVSPNLNNINFIHNTFVDGTPIELDTATNNTWANNIFKKTSGAIFSGSTIGKTFAGNNYSGTLGVTISSGMTAVDSQLAINSDGYYGLSATSPINNASASYPAIFDIASIDDDPTLLLDISGQARPATVTLKDVGADEYSTGTSSNRPLVLSEVGPSFLGGPGSKLNQTITFNPIPTKDIGESDFSAGASASSGLTVSLASSNTAVATILSGTIHIVGVGNATITASQVGDASYNAATNSTQLLTVTAATAPSTIFNLADWKLQTIDSSNLQTDVLAPALNAGYISPLFYTSTADGSMVCKVPSNGGTTSGSSYPRVELRQMTGGANWALADTTEHYLSAQCKVIDVATAKPQIIIGQIHGSETNSELLKIRWTGYLPGQCYIEARFERNDATQAEYGVTLATGLSLGDMITYTVTMKSGTINCTVNGVTASQTYTAAYFGSTDAYYFKAGNYFQYNNQTVPDPTLIYGKTQFYKLALQRQTQSITFNPLPNKIVGNADFSAEATASSGLAVSLASSNEAVATIVNGNIHIVGVGSTTITASQAGDLGYSAATDVSQSLSVSGLSTHTIAFSLPLKYTNSPDFDPAAVSSIGSPVTYTSSNPAVATIVNNKIHIVGKGTSNITASAVGNASNDAATNMQQLIVQCSCVQ